MNVTGEPVRPVALAVAVFVPAVLPRVSVVCACPSVLVTMVAADSEPPPVAIANVTMKPETGFPPASFTTTTNGLSAVATVALWLFPDTSAI